MENSQFKLRRNLIKGLNYFSLFNSACGGTRILLESAFLFARILISKPVSIWIGDSHAHFLIKGGKRLKPFALIDGKHLLIWVGPKLLYSVANRGFQFNRLANILLRKSSSGQPIVIILGEIDCRVHFVSKNLQNGIEDFRKIAYSFRTKILQLQKELGFGSTIIFSPVPPSDIGNENESYPRIGTLDERVAVTRLITQSLIELSNRDFKVLNLGDILATERGELNPVYTDDGVHVNSIGSSEVLKSLPLFLKESEG
jgi:hypothetical protein